jgi:hypothetical protein
MVIRLFIIIILISLLASKLNDYQNAYKSLIKLSIKLLDAQNPLTNNTVYTLTNKLFNGYNEYIRPVQNPNTKCVFL